MCAMWPLAHPKPSPGLALAPEPKADGVGGQANPAVQAHPHPSSRLLPASRLFLPSELQATRRIRRRCSSRIQGPKRKPSPNHSWPPRNNQLRQGGQSQHPTVEDVELSPQSQVPPSLVSSLSDFSLRKVLCPLHRLRPYRYPTIQEAQRAQGSSHLCHRFPQRAVRLARPNGWDPCSNSRILEPSEDVMSARLMCVPCLLESLSSH